MDLELSGHEVARSMHPLKRLLSPLPNNIVTINSLHANWSPQSRKGPDRLQGPELKFHGSKGFAHMQKQKASGSTRSTSSMSFATLILRSLETKVMCLAQWFPLQLLIATLAAPMIYLKMRCWVVPCKSMPLKVQNCTKRRWGEVVSS